MKQKRKNKWQTAMFDSYGKPLTEGEGRVATGTGRRADFLSVLEEQRTSTEGLLNKILEHGNVRKAAREVMKNKGASGVDGKSIEETIEWLGKNYEDWTSEVEEGRYRVEAARKVEIPKPDGGKRILGIPTVKDRIIQQAIHQQLNGLYDRHFSESSYGFRPGKDAKMAIERSSEYVKEGYEWVVDIDLEKYFDTIPHNRLMQRLSKGIGDKRVLRLIRQYLEAGMMEGGLESQRLSGSPQGGPLSPLLSNIVLDELDKELESRGHRFCRYADDCNIFVKSRRAGERVMESTIEFIEKKLHLKVNRNKSGVRKCSEVKFLGYTILEGGDRRISDKSLERLKKKVIEITKRNRGVEFATVITELNLVIQGFGVYYCLANKWLAVIRDIDGWIRRRLRCFRLKQCGGTYTLVKFLGSLGVNERKSWNASYWYRQGWWNLTLYPAICNAMSTHWFEEQGLKSLLKTINRYN